MGKEEAVQVGVIARALLDCLLSVLFAPPCAACGVSLEEPLDGPVCPACWSSIPPVPARFHVDDIDRAAAVGPYDGALREIVHAFKYQRRRSLARPLAGLLVHRCGDILAGADVAIPVPLHASRERERGFNQAALLARALPLPCADLLARVRATPSQTDLPASQRRANVRGVFAVGRSRLPAAWSRQHVDVSVAVLVDDVVTTGATLSECARVLRRAGVTEVRAVAIARKL